MSEHSTTDDYATATENNSGTDTSSRRSCGDVVGLPPTQEAEGPTVEAGAGGGDASSFESAYSLARDESLPPHKQAVESTVMPSAPPPAGASRASTPSGDASSSSGRSVAYFFHKIRLNRPFPVSIIMCRSFLFSSVFVSTIEQKL